MGTSLRLFIRNLLLVFLLHLDMYTDFDELFMVYNRRHVLGMSVFDSLSYLLVTYKA